MARPRLLVGGSAANAELTALAAAALILLLAVEGATLLRLQALLTVHAFVGMLLIPLVALKLGSTGWRAVRYYRHAEEYVAEGPPHVALRLLVAPVLVLSTVALFATGVSLLAVDQVHGTLVGLHKASFIVWFGAASVHVLAHLGKLVRVLGRRVYGNVARIGLVATTVVAGVALAFVTLPSAEHLQDQATNHFSIDRR